MSEETQDQPPGVTGNDLLSKAVSMAPIPVGYTGNVFGWQLVPMTGEDGKKFCTAVLSISDGNGIDLYFYGPEDMAQFAQAAQQAHGMQMMENARLNPLQVVSPQQMQGLINAQGLPLTPRRG
jgi:hypothetical protein